MIAALALLGLGVPAQAAFQCPAEIVEADHRFSGIYVDDFEGQRFFEGAGDLGNLDFRARPQIWFEPDIVGAGARFGIERRVPGHAYRVTFRGTKRSRVGGGRPPFPCGYGHLGMSDAQIDLIALERIDRLGPAR